MREFGTGPGVPEPSCLRPGVCRSVDSAARHLREGRLRARQQIPDAAPRTVNIRRDRLKITPHALQNAGEPSRIESLHLVCLVPGLPACVVQSCFELADPLLGICLELFVTLLRRSEACAEVVDDLAPRLGKRKRFVPRRVRVGPLHEVQVREKTSDRRDR